MWLSCLKIPLYRKNKQDVADSSICYVTHLKAKLNSQVLRMSHLAAMIWTQENLCPYYAAYTRALIVFIVIGSSPSGEKQTSCLLVERVGVCHRQRVLHNGVMPQKKKITCSLLPGKVTYNAALARKSDRCFPAVLTKDLRLCHTFSHSLKTAEGKTVSVGITGQRLHFSLTCSWQPDHPFSKHEMPCLFSWELKHVASV